jgi:hypothetical protein
VNPVTKSVEFAIRTCNQRALLWQEGKIPLQDACSEIDSRRRVLRP